MLQRQISVSVKSQRRRVFVTEEKKSEMLWQAADYISYLTGRSFKMAWGGEVSTEHTLHHWVPSYKQMVSHTIALLMTHSSISRSDDPKVAAWISGCLKDNSAWMKEHHLQLNLAKTELLVFPDTPTLQHDFTIQLGSSTITPSSSVRNLGVIFDDQLTFKDHIAKTARSCRFALHNIRKIRPFLTLLAAQLLVQALVISRLDYCNALLAGLPSCTIKPLQMIQNAAARLVFSKPKRAHVTRGRPIIGADIKHFTDYRYRPFSKQICR